MTTTLTRVRAIIAARLDIDPDAVTADSNIFALGADDLTALEILMAIEDLFDIEIPDEAAERIQVVGDAVRLIDAKTAKVEVA